MNNKEVLKSLCEAELESRNINDERYKKRLKAELRQIDNFDEHGYFLDLFEKDTKYPYNENNLLVAYLLRIVDDFNIEEDFAFTQGDFPDIDVDFMPEVKDYLKRDWAPKEFGEECVSAIATYGSLGIKQAVLDMTKVHGVSKDEIQSITVKMEDKDDEGKHLVWDKAIELYPDFAKFCEKNPDIASAAKLIVGRNKARGVHAGGLIIADRPIFDIVPVEVDKREINVSAWGEGLRSQDLGPVGFIKFDLLAIGNLVQIAYGVKLVKERYGLKRVCAIGDQKDWSDTAYLNDPKAITMANKADLKGIFQFDSEGIRNLVKRGGVNRFDDLEAYSALFRPGPLGSGMADSFTKRKRGLEKYEVHPVMKPILARTYGIMVYQEQVMQILNIVGQIPMKDCLTVQKAISKKKIAQFAKYKDTFVKNGQKVLGWAEEDLIKLWEQIEKFSGYGFNKSHCCAYTYISSRLLWLKAHYPLEFYTAILMVEERYDKIKEYKKDAQNHGINIQLLNINKSKQDFAIIDDEIYFGFCKVRGIGKDIADRIIAGQPYDNFKDFLLRFGTELKVVKPLVALGVFDDEGDRLDTYKFYEYYKELNNKKKSRAQRYEVSLKRYREELKEILGEEYEHLADFTDDNHDKWEKLFSQEMIEQQKKVKGEMRDYMASKCDLLNKIAEKREKSIRVFKGKELEDRDDPLGVEFFHPDRVLLDPPIERLLLNDEDAQEEFYGFLWIHPLEQSPDFSDLSIEDFLSRVESENVRIGPIEVMIKSCKEKKSRKNADFKYYSAIVEDANCREASVTIWDADYLRFKKELRPGNLVRMRVRPPGTGYKTLTLESPAKRDRHRLPSKERDFRLIELRRNSKNQEIDLGDLTL